nr:LpqB family beta-propeller domain-containing protein [Motilibacter deserti]
MLALPVWFADPSGRALVPDQVYLPKGDDEVPAALTRRLLAGPGPGLQGAVETAIPSGTRLVDARVVSGEAFVELAGPVTRLPAERRQLALAQLGRSLAAVPGVDGPVQVTLGTETFDATGADNAFDPLQETLVPGPNVLVIDRNGKLQTFNPGDAQLGVMPGALGAFARPLRHPARSLPATPQRIAALSDGERGLQVQEPDGTLHRVHLARTGPLAPPAFDAHGNVWTVDRATGDVLVTASGEDAAAPVQVPTALLEGYRPWQVEPAHDGARVVLVLRSTRQPADDRVVVAAVLPPAGGTGYRLGGAVLPLQGSWQQVHDLDWRSPTSLAMLVVDGDNSRALFLTPGTVGVATGPTVTSGVDEITAPPTRTGGTLLVASSSGRPAVFALDESDGLSNALQRGLRDPAYAG